MKKYKANLKQYVWVWLFLATFVLMMYASFPGANTRATINLATTPAAQTLNGNEGVLRVYDVRVNGKAEFSQLIQNRLAAAQQRSLVRANSLTTAIAQITAKNPDIAVRISATTGSAELVESKTGALTGIDSSRQSVDIVKGFIKENVALYGLDVGEVDQLHFIGESVTPGSGLRMVRIEQMVNGIPVFQSEMRAILDRDGRLVRTLGLFASDSKSAESYQATISPAQAMVNALAPVGITLDGSKILQNWLNNENTKAEMLIEDEQAGGKVTAKLVYFPLAPGVLIPAWSQTIFTSGKYDWYTLVDAQTGVPLWRKNIRADASAHDARFRVYVQADGKTPADSPAPQSPNTAAPGAGAQFPGISPTIVSMHTVFDPIASPNGWINDCPGGGCTANETQTLGNNVQVCLDIDQISGGADVCDTSANNVVDGNGKPTGNPDANGRNRDFLGTTPRDFQTNFLPPPQGGNPEAGQTATGSGTAPTIFRRGMMTHLFYLSNWYHDQTYSLGFNEASGNFQLTNFTGMGLGGDRVQADAQDGSGVDNANFSTPPDGMPGRMQMYRFTGPTIDRDGGLDAEIALHELTHGLSNRLVGNAVGLNWDPAVGMGEGWSDFYALSLLNNTNADNPDGRYASGAYVTYKFRGSAYLDNYVYGIRRFPYSTDNTVNPLTWADVDDVTNDLSGGITPDPLGLNNNGGGEVHNIGEIWALTLWEMRSRIIHDPMGANNSVPTGNVTSLRLVTDALKMTPIDPSFTEARDAIIAADGATNNYANEQSIWAAFADRGLGYKASAPIKIAFGFLSSHLGIAESFSVPYLDIKNQATDVVLSDTPGGNNNGSVDPGEQVNFNLTLTNPWRNASKAASSITATLTTATPGVTIVNEVSNYANIAPQGTAVNNTPFSVRFASSIVCGTSVNFTLTTASSLGTTSTTFRLRVGKANGTDPVITYTGDPNPNLAIPDNTGRGVKHQINVTDDFVIADLNFRIDSITHPRVGNISAMLRSPEGYGSDFISLIDGLNDTGGANITNMVADDDLPVTVANDMVQATSANAPYTKSWLPVFNAPWPPIAGFPTGPDPVGQLSRFDGQSTKGTWSVVVSDQLQGSTGTFNAWSMIVTPVHFDCTPFVCPAPTVICPANITQSTGAGVCTAVVTFTATASSSCSTPGAVTCMPASGSTFQKGTTTVNCSVTDDLNQTGSCSFTVTVVDSQNPMITCPANITASTTQGQCSAVVTYTTPSGSDNCPLPPNAVTCTPASGSTFPKGTTTVNCTVTDGANLTNSCSFTVTVNDNQNPTVTCPANVITSTTTNQCSALVTYTTPTGSDNCTLPANAVSCSPTSGSTFPKGTTTVTCTVTDAANLTGSCTFTVTVNDNQNPTLTCPPNQTVNTASSPVVVNYPAPTASDNCPGVGTPVCTPPSGSMFATGTTTVNCSVKDASNNSATCSFTVTVVTCTFSCPANIVRANDPNQCGAVVTFAPSSTSGCGTVSCSPPSGSFFPKGTTTVSCTTSAGPKCSFTVTVNDTQPPAITCPANQTAVITAANATCVVVNYPAPVATDNCPGVGVVCSPPAGTCFALGVTTVNCTATDASGNTATCSFTVSTFDVCIQDDSNPGTVILLNSATGAYRFCCNGTSYTGTGVVTKKGNVVTLDHTTTTRRVYAKADRSTFTGTGWIQQPPGTNLCSITDRDIRNNTCSCQ